MDLRYFLSAEHTETYHTNVALAAYKRQIERYNNLVVTDIEEGIQVKWKPLPRGLNFRATCVFSQEETLKITVGIVGARLIQFQIIFWSLFGMCHAITVPSSNTLVFVPALWMFWVMKVSNRNYLQKLLAPEPKS